MTNTPKWARKVAPPETRNPRILSNSRGRMAQETRPSVHQKPASSSGASAMRVTGPGETQPVDRASRSPMTKQVNAPNRVAAPTKSKDCLPACSPSPGARWPRPIHHTPSAKASTVKGILPRNTASQSNHRTSRPAPSVPASIPVAWLADVKPMPSPRRDSGNRLAAMAGETAYKHPVPKGLKHPEPHQPHPSWATRRCRPSTQGR